MSHGHVNKPQPPPPETIAAGHETTDATAKALVIFMISLAVTVVVIVLIGLGIFTMMNTTDESNAEYPSSPLADQRPPSPAPPLQPALGDANNPLHETMPYQDWSALKAEFVRLAGTYGNDEMADHKMHNHMPVEAAIDLLAENGIPSNTAVDIPAPQGVGNSMPTPYSDGGRGSSTDKAAAPGVPPEQK
jgi:hypothetical protein